MNQGLDANLVFVDDLENELEEPGGVDYHDPAKMDQFKLLDNWTLARSMDEEPTSLKEAFEGLDGAKWKRGLERDREVSSVGKTSEVWCSSSSCHYLHAVAVLWPNCQEIATKMSILLPVL